MSERIQGDNEAWGRWLESYPVYASKHNNQKFYDTFNKLLHVVKAKASADMQLLRWLNTDLDAFRGNVSVYLVTMGTEVAYLLARSDLSLKEELQLFLLDEYRRAFVAEMKPITIQEQLLRRYERAVEGTLVVEGERVDSNEAVDSL